MKKKEKKKGVSPVIATVLLIAMVIVIALIVFLWFKEIGGEVITKFEKNIELVCDDVSFSAEYRSDKLFVSNTGNVPIFNIKVKVKKQGEFKTLNIGELGEWPDLGLDQGGVFTSDSLGSEADNAQELVLIPALMGTSDKGERIHVCDERHGYEITI